jgi:hypothetical protein
VAPAKKAQRNGKAPVAEPETYPREVTLASSGVTLAIKKVSPWILQARVKNFKSPVPPIVKNEEKGREEENHNDPDFLLAQREYIASTAEAVTDTLLLMGTSLLHLPEGIEGPDSEEWDATLSALHLSAEGQDSKSRYLSWLKYTVLVDQEELGAVMAAVSRASGIASEVDIANAMAVFRSGEVQPADREVAPEVSGNGDHVPEAVAGGRPPD